MSIDLILRCISASKKKRYKYCIYFRDLSISFLKQFSLKSDIFYSAFFSKETYEARILGALNYLVNSL